jgi:hypothetical protein
MSERYDLGPPPAGTESYEVGVEWDAERQRVYITDWNPYDACYMSWAALSAEQMDKLCAWWTHLPERAQVTEKGEESQP